MGACAHGSLLFKPAPSSPDGRGTRVTRPRSGQSLGPNNVASRGSPTSKQVTVLTPGVTAPNQTPFHPVLTLSRPHGSGHSGELTLGADRPAPWMEASRRQAGAPLGTQPPHGVHAGAARKRLVGICGDPRGRGGEMQGARWGRTLGAAGGSAWPLPSPAPRPPRRVAFLTRASPPRRTSPPCQVPSVPDTSAVPPPLASGRDTAAPGTCARSARGPVP